MQTKTCAVTVKAAGPTDGLEEGVVEAIVATYDVDSIGDQIMPGAFADTLTEWKSSGAPIPFIWNHQSADPEAHIGWIEHAEERPGQGLYVKARIDMEEPSARRIYKLLKGRRVQMYSFAYDELDARPPSEKAAPGARKELHRLKLWEAGPTPIGCNLATSTVDVKAQPAIAVADPAGDAVEVARAVALGYRLAGADSAHIVPTPVLKSDPDAYSTVTYSYEPRLMAALEAFETEVKSVETEAKAATGGVPKPIATRIRRLQAAIQALADAVDPGTDSNAEKATPPASAPASSHVADEAAPETKSESAMAGTASARLRTDLALLMAEADSYTTEESA